jgi:hypothetical protein
MNKVKAITLFCIFSIKVFAQSGPIVPCVNCANFSMRTMPMSGIWYNPEQSGSGFSIEIQNRKIFGAYYGYDESGQPLWLTFIGELQDSESPEIMWTVETKLLKFINGNCINCNYNAPNPVEFNKMIKIDFMQKNYASFSIDGGASQNIVPIIFGSSATADFSPEYKYLLPDLKGTWNFLFDINEETNPDYPWQWGYLSLPVSIDEKILQQDTLGNREVLYLVYTFSSPISPPPEGAFIGTIRCYLEKNAKGVYEPICVFSESYGLSPISSQDYRFTLGGLGAKRLFGESEGGHTFEGVRVDYTGFGEIPQK